MREMEYIVYEQKGAYAVITISREKEMCIRDREYDEVYNDDHTVPYGCADSDRRRGCRRGTG